MRTEERRGVPIAIAAAIPLLSLRCGLGFFRFLAQRRRGVRTFERALLAGGMPRDRAAQLAQKYRASGSLRALAKQPRLQRKAGPRGQR